METGTGQTNRGSFAPGPNRNQFASPASHRDHDPRLWRRTRGNAGAARVGAQAPAPSLGPDPKPEPQRPGSHVTPVIGARHPSEEARSAMDLAVLEPPWMPDVTPPDVRDRYKFPEEFPEGPYGMRPDPQVKHANGTWHRGQRAVSSQADTFSFDVYRYDLDYDPVVGSRGDRLPANEAAKVPFEAAPDVGEPTAGGAK